MVIGMSRRDGRRKYKRIGKRKNQIFLVMMTILACTVAIVLTVKMNNKNVHPKKNLKIKLPACWKQPVRNLLCWQALCVF